MKSLKINYFFSIFKSIMAGIFPLISFPYATRILGVSNIGSVSYCSSVISYFAMFSALGISLYATREGAKIKDNREELSKLSVEVFTINIISTVIVYTIFLITLFLNAFDTSILLMLVSSLSIWFTTLGVEWIYQIEEEFAYISIRSFIVQLVALLILFVFVRDKNDYVIYAFVQVFAAGGAFWLNLFHSKKYIDWRIKHHLNLKRHIKPILIIFAIGASSSIYINLDTIMIRIIHSDYEVGLYAAAVKVVNLVKTVLNSLSIVLISRLSNYSVNKEDKSAYSGLLNRGFAVNLSFIVPCGIGICMLSRQIILIIAGSSYLAATTALRILSMNLIFAALDGMIYYQILIPNRKDVLACIGTAFGATVDLILNALLIPDFGINGAATATLLSELMVFIWFLFFIRKEEQLKKLFVELPKICIAGVSIVVICRITDLLISNWIIETVVAVVVSILVYFILLKICHAYLAEEVDVMFHKIWSSSK